MLFPTDERFLGHGTTTAGMGIYNIGTALVRGHDMGFTTRGMSKSAREVTSVAWSTEGELISVGDDYRVRCWRENAEIARDLRLSTDGEAGRWDCGWADVQGDWDDEDG